MSAEEGQNVDVDEEALMEDASVGVEEDHDFDDVPVSSTSSAAARRAADRQLAREVRDLREKKLARLAELKKEADSKKAASETDKAASTMEYLMRISTEYTNIATSQQHKDGHPGTASAPSATASSAASGKRGHHRLTEKEEDEELVADAAEARHSSVRLLKQPSLVSGGTMREYQLEGLNWMINLHDNDISGILADEMGLGKTLQSISLLAYLKEFRGVTGPHLVLVPKSTIGNWVREFNRWCPSLKTLRLQGADKEERQRIVREELLGGDYDVIVTSFETLCIEHSAFKKFAWYYIVIDEAHRIKNEKSALAVRVRQLSSQFRLLLTGTPLQNNLHELWALLNFLLPEVFTSAEDFDTLFATSGSNLADNDMVKKLHAILRPFLLRRLKADVERSLLPKIETKLYIGMSAVQRQWYKTVLSKDVTALNAIGGTDRVRLLNILMQLRKVCNHPYLFDGAEPGPPYMDGPHLWESSGKMVLLDKLLPKLKAAGSRCLIFSQMTRMLDILEDYCRLKDYGYCRIDGNTSGEDRDRSMDEYNAPDSSKFVFLLSTRAGGLGINLYTADVVILYDSDWNPQADLQAMDRAHRIGQKKQVRVFRFVTENTVEEKIVERAERKLFLDAVVIQQGRLANADKTLSKGELMTMVKFGADEIFRSGAETEITDADIDALLAKGEERTKEGNEKLKRDMAHTLSSFDKLDFSGKDQSMYLYGTEDMAEISAINSGVSVGNFIDFGPRERKQRITYNEAAAYAAQYNAAGVNVPGRKAGPAKIKAPTMNDFQFFDKARIEAIVAKENSFVAARREIQNKLKEARSRESKEQKKFVKQRTMELLEGKEMPEDPEAASALEVEVSAKAEAEWASKETELESAQLEKELYELDLSPDEKAEKERLMAQGYADWSKRDFRAFITACERHGRTAKEAVIAEVAETTEKPIDNVAKYYETFMSRCTELSDWDKVNEKIAKGEQKIKRREAMETIIAEKVGKTIDPFRTLAIPYQMQSSRGQPLNRGFTEDEDRFLVCMLNVLGYGAWDSLRMEIRRSEQFRFNWFIKSRTSEDIHKRCDALIRVLEREAGESGLISEDVFGRKRGRTAAKDSATAGRKRKRSTPAAAGAGTSGTNVTEEIEDAPDSDDDDQVETPTKASSAKKSRR